MGYALLMGSTSRSANAAEWSTQPSVRLGWEHNDNPLLATGSHESVSGSTFSPKLDLGVSSDIWQVKGSAEMLQKRFSGEPTFDVDDQYYNLNTSYNTERSSWQLAGTETKSTTIAEEQVSPVTGVVNVPIVYTTQSINPSWTWAVNELTQLQLGYSLSNASYVNGQSAGLFDYTTRGVSAQLSNWLDSNNQVFLSGGYSIFNVPSTTLESKSANYQAGITQIASETMRWTLSAGTRRTSSEQTVSVCTVFFGPFCLQTENETQFSKVSSSIYSASLTKKYEISQLDVTLNRAFDPSGLGGQVRRDSEEVSINRQLLTSRLNGYLYVANYQYKSETGNLSNVDHRFYTFRPGLNWRWTEELTADLSYQYRHVKEADVNQPATSRSVYLTLNYVWPRMSFSR